MKIITLVVVNQKFNSTLFDNILVFYGYRSVVK
jgi:hypothetical protein